jgi:hypothetical protein
MAELLNVWKPVMLLVPIVALLIVGIWTTLRSGLVSIPGSGSAVVRTACENLARTVAMVVLCLLALLVIQHVVGFRVSWPAMG